MKKLFLTAATLCSTLVFTGCVNNNKEDGSTAKSVSSAVESKERDISSAADEASNKIEAAASSIEKEAKENTNYSESPEEAALTSKNSFEEIYDVYAEKLKNTSNDLMANAEEEIALNTDDQTEVEKLISEKSEKLRQISTQGIAKMANKMLGDKSKATDYRKWSAKLNKLQLDEVRRLVKTYHGE